MSRERSSTPGDQGEDRPHPQDAWRGALILGGGAALLVLATLGAVLLREKVGFVVHGDAGVERAAHRAVLGNPWLLTAARDVTHAGDTVVRYAIGLVALGYLAARRLWRLAAFLVVAVAGAQILVAVLKPLVDRARPVLAHPVAHAGGSSFPSGHAMGSTALYGALLIIAYAALSRMARLAVVAFVLLLIAAVCTSRVLLGVHFLSDVVAGALLAVAWLAVAAGACRPWRQGLVAGRGRASPSPGAVALAERSDLAPGVSGRAASDRASTRHRPPSA